MSAPTGSSAGRRASLRREVLGALVLIAVEGVVGVAVNLDVTIPTHHSGANPATYLAGSGRSVAWAVAHGGAALAVHTVLGLALAVMVIRVTVGGWSAGSTVVRGWLVLGALLVVGAAFSGASFLDYNKSADSLMMACGAFGAMACYGVVLSRLGSTG